jgi:putative phosphoesterase
LLDVRKVIDMPKRPKPNDTHVLGVISDTHGLVRPEAVEALEGTDMIIHAGDIGTPEVLEALHAMAPVVAVRGNNDKGDWALALPETEVVEVGGVALYVLHDVHALDLDPVAAGFHAVISGHSHRPAMAKRQGVLFLNPGSAGPRRFKLPVSVARLIIRGNAIDGQLVELAG